MKKILLNVIGAFLMGIHLLFAQFVEPTGTLLPTPDLSSEGHRYGASVAIEGDFAVVGAPGENAAYILFHNGSEWVQQAKLVAADGKTTDEFGASVAIKGNIITVGATSNGKHGAVYVFTNSQKDWSNPTQIAKLTPAYESTTTGSIGFGHTMSISSELIVVGSHKKVAFLFEKPESGWSNVTQTAVLTSSTASTSSFGKNVSVSGSTVALSDEFANNKGSVYIYEKPVTGWQNATEDILLSLENSHDHHFGRSVSIHSNTLAVGALEKDDYMVGSIYVYEKSASGWQGVTPSAVLSLADTNEGQLGASVQVSGNNVLAGDYLGNAVFLYAQPSAGWTSTDQPTNVLRISDKQQRETFPLPTVFSTDSEKTITGASWSGEGGAVYLHQHSDKVDQKEDQKISAPPLVTAAGDFFGSFVAIDQDYAVVVSSGDYVGGNRGSAYVYHYQNKQWNKIARLTPSVSSNRDIFIRSVDISGNTIVLGVSSYLNLSLAALVYERPRDGWMDMTETAKLSLQDDSYYRSRGTSVSIDNNTIVLSAFSEFGVIYDCFCKNPDTTIYSTVGAAFVYTKPADGWADMTQTAKLTASNESRESTFGASVALLGNTIAVGAPDDALNQGVVYVFEKPQDKWIDAHETATLTASNGGSGDDLGASVSIFGNTILASAPGRKFTEAPATAYVFEQPASGWANSHETARLTADIPNGMGMGYATALSENTVALTSFGSVLLYLKPDTGWASAQPTLTIKDGDIRDVALDSGRMIGGAPIESVQEKNAGAAYLYSISSNVPPVLMNPVADQMAMVDTVFSLGLKDVLTAYLADGRFAYRATLLGKDSLPAWLSFDANSLTLTGTPRAGDVDTLQIQLIANKGVVEVSTGFKLTVQMVENDNKEETEEEQPMPEVDNTVTAINESIRQTKVQAYPNPSVGQLTITSTEAIEQVQLSNAQGQVMFNQQFANGNTEVKLQTLSPGLYWINVRTSQSTFTQRIIVQ